MASIEKWIDYYKWLGVTNSASEQQIRSAYRRLALEIHPDKNKSADATEKFKKLGRAYETLTNKDLKAKYDSELVEYACFYPHFNSRVAPQDPAVVHNVFVTLEEIFRGCNKKMRICRSFNKNGKVIHFQDKSFDIDVNAGCKKDFTITFPRAGNRHPHRIPADLIFVIKEYPHSYFSRIADGDLKYCGTFTVEQALFDREIKIQLLGGTVKKIPFTDEDVQEVFVKCFKGLGFPNSLNPSEKGDLITEFRLQFKDEDENAKKILLDEIRIHRKRTRIS